MSLESTAFRDSTALQACATQDQAHVTRGATGDHVSRLHFALFATDGVGVADAELSARRYGPSTAAAVLAYKTRRSIINRAYQSAPDDIVGKMTVASLDQELLTKQGQPGPVRPTYCACDPRHGRGLAAHRSRAGITPASAPAHPPQAPDPVQAPPAQSPQAKALERLGDAQLAIAKTRATLQALTRFRPVSNTTPGTPSLPPAVMVLFDKVWRNFGPPTGLPYESTEFPPITTLAEFLTAIDSHYARMQGTLGQANALFRTIDQSRLGTAHALTLTTDRVPGDPTDLPNGVYFGRRFAESGPNKQTEVVVHEAAHFKDGHAFGDHFSFYGPSWGKFDGRLGMLNAWSYSMFVLDVVFDRQTPFD